jgi:hypothetical protein
MQRIISDSNEQMRRLKAETDDTNSSENLPRQPTESYFQRMFLIVSESFELSGHTPTDEEKASRAEVWAEHLFDLVPENYLERCFKRAFHAHAGNYIVTAYDIKDAYQAMSEEEKAAAVARGSSFQLSTDGRVENCPNKANHLPNRFGEVMVFIPGITEDDTPMPCQRCRAEDHAAARLELTGGKQEPTFAEASAKVVEIFR